LGTGTDVMGHPSGTTGGVTGATDARSGGRTHTGTDAATATGSTGGTGAAGGTGSSGAGTGMEAVPAARARRAVAAPARAEAVNDDGTRRRRAEPAAVS